MRVAALLLLLTAAVTFRPAAVGAQITGRITGTSPSPLAFEILANQSTEGLVNVEVMIPFAPAGGVDVLFLTDTTSSMEQFIQPIRTAMAVAARSLLGHDNLDLRFAVADYKDFGDGQPYDSRGYGLKQAFTNDLGEIVSGIQNLTLGGGGGDAEQNLAALHNIGLEWEAFGGKPDRQKLVIWFGDSPGFEGFSPYPTLEDTIGSLFDQGIEVYAFNPFQPLSGIDAPGPKASGVPQASTITGAVGGLTLNNAPVGNSEFLATLIQSAIMHGAANISQLRLEVDGDLGGWEFVSEPIVGPFNPDEEAIQATFQLLLTAPPIYETVEVDLVLVADGVELDRLSNSQQLMFLTFACILGDMNGDSLVDAFDVSFLEMALADRRAYAELIGIDPDLWADFNGDGVLDAFDVALFEAAVGEMASVHLPEPAGAVVLGVLLLGTGRRARANRP